ECFFCQAEDGIRDFHVTGVQTCALPISHRHVVGEEQLVGHGGVEGHRHVLAVDRGLRGHQPLLVRGGGEGKRQRQGDDERVLLHLMLLGGYLIDRLTAPSSLLPWALPAWVPVAGQVNGIFSSSRPPTSRTASTTRVYWPACSLASRGEAASTLITCLPTGRVGPVTPSTGRSRLRPDLRHHWRRSGSHLVPWPSAVSFIWYHTARSATALLSAPSIHTAT